MKILISAWMLSIGAVVGMSCSVQAGTVTFGSGTNTFNMEFVTIGNPGNAPDTTGSPNPAGSVGYTYGIGKFEVSEDLIMKYNVLNPGLQISKDSRGANKPATSVSWNEAARFVNWLNTSTGNQAAYKFTTSGVNDNIELWIEGEAGYNATNPYRNSLAKYLSQAKTSGTRQRIIVLVMALILNTPRVAIQYQILSRVGLQKTRQCIISRLDRAQRMSIKRVA